MKIEENFKIDILQVLAKHNFVSETAFRNEKIIFEYKELRNGGMSGKDARQKLAEENFTSIKNIEFILYGKKKNGN